MIALTCCQRQFPGYSMGGGTKTKASSLTGLREEEWNLQRPKQALICSTEHKREESTQENEPQRTVGGLWKLFAEY